jgi:hypothetical protein
MSQGTRGRLVRVAATGLGVLICTGLVGCMGMDKPKDTKQTKAPQQGLPGIIPANNGGVPRTGQPQANANTIPGANLAANTYSPTGVNANNRFASNGNNTLNTPTAQTPNYGPFGNQPGQPAVIGAPAQTGVVPASGTQNPAWNTSGNVPPPPSLVEPVPPPPPAYSPDTYGSGPVAPAFKPY